MKNWTAIIFSIGIFLNFSTSDLFAKCNWSVYQNCMTACNQGGGSAWCELTCDASSGCSPLAKDEKNPELKDPELDIDEKDHPE